MYLNCKTYFSYRYGTFATEELVKAGAETGATALALTNINGTTDTWDFVKFCRRGGIKPIVGAEIRNGADLLYILLAANNRGFKWINDLLTTHLHDKSPFPAGTWDTPFFYDVYDGYVIYPLGKKLPGDLLQNEFIGVKPSEVNKLFTLPINQFQSKFIARQPVTFQNKSNYNLHKLLRAIDKNVVGSLLAQEEIAGKDEHFVAQADIFKSFGQYPNILTNTYRLIDSCNIEMDFEADKNKKNFTGSKEDDRVLLRTLAESGFHNRYDAKNKVALERLRKELKVIDELGFNAYFLRAEDLVRYAGNRRFYHVGRGSGANSIVAYCLRITDVDPVELNLYFERFLNPERTSPPDFDIDFSWLDRDEIIDYILKRYGKNHTALLGMYSTFQYKASVRELGKVFGLPKEELDALSDGRPSKDHIHRQVMQYAKMLVNFPNHLSIHPGGILITEEPITNYAALDMPPKGFPTAQIDMFIAEGIRIDKLDILSQRGLGHIKETIRLVKQHREIDIDITQVEKFKNDPLIRAQIKKGDTIGCFYVESPAMRQLLKKLRCDTYKTLVEASSIIRPGVAESGMMREYIKRYHNPTGYKPLHPQLHEILKDTYDVMVFQEDVIRVGHEFAGLSLGEADVLRRAMSGKYRSNNTFQIIKKKFFNNCIQRGHSEALAAEVWRQMESFAGYSFCKAHSASFAVESFQDLFLKVYYPLEFMVGVINNFGGYYSTDLYFYQLIKGGAKINVPCVNTSEYLTYIVGTVVYTGMVHIKNIEKKLVESLLLERGKNGVYLHLQDFIERTAITIESLETLIHIGALRFTGKNKKALLWEAAFLQKKSEKYVPTAKVLFKEDVKDFRLPEFSIHPLDDMYDEQEILGYPLRNPFEMVDDDPAKYIYAKDIDKHLGQECTVLVYFISDKVVPTKKNTTMAFGTFIDANLDWLDTVHFPGAYTQYPMQGRGFYKITGRVIEEFGVHSLEVSYLTKVGYKQRTYANL